MDNSRERRIFSAAGSLLTVDEKHYIAGKIGVSYTTVQNTIMRRTIDRYNIAEACLELLQGNFEDLKQEVRKVERYKQKLNALDWESINAGIKYIQQL